MNTKIHEDLMMLRALRAFVVNDSRPRRELAAGRDANGERMKILLVASLIAFGADAARAQDVGIPLGQVPQAVVVEDLDGGPVDLGALAGSKPMLVEFWATWCPLCRALEPQLASAAQRYGDRLEVVIVAVGVNQSPRTVKRHLDKHALPGRVVFDGQGKATRAFQAPSTSYVVVLDAAGRVAYTGVGEDQDLAGVLARVMADAAPR